MRTPRQRLRPFKPNPNPQATMGFINRLFGKSGTPPLGEVASTQLAFVLISEVQMPTADEIAGAFAEFAPGGETLRVKADDDEDGGEETVHMFELGTGETSFVALMPAAVPDGEADHGAQHSMSGLGGEWTPPEHCAHLIVTLLGSEDCSPVDQLSRFTSLLAAVTKVAPTVGVYWGNAGATHEPDFFLSIAAELDVVPRIMLWSGVSVAHEDDGRLSMLSLGMDQLGLPDLLLVAPPSASSDALETFYDLLAYVAERGEPLPDGDTVGRTATQHLPVRYVRSPVDRKKKVWRVEME